MKKVFAYLYYHNFNNDYQYLEEADYLNLSFGKIALIDGIYQIDMSDVKDALLMLKDNVKNAHIVLSIGGWGAGGFSEAIENEKLRKAFISSIIKVVEEYQLSGIDLDWEYPTVSIGKVQGRIEDRHNYSILIKELKKALMTLSKDLILTAAVPCTTKYYEVEELNKYLDYLHIMSYDLDYGTDYTCHLAAPFNSKYTESSAHLGLLNWTKDGFASEKIVLGCAMYVRKEEVLASFNHGLGVNHLTFTTLTYRNYCKLNIPTYYDEEAKATYGFKDNCFYSFDGVESIMAKVKLVKDLMCAGLMCWEYHQDDEEHHLFKAMLKVKE